MNAGVDPHFGGYAWDVNASRDLDARLGEFIARHGTRMATDAEMQAAEDRAREEWREEKSRVLLSRLPNNYRSAEPRHPEAERWLLGYFAGQRRNMVIVGPAGVGKTWEASALARMLLMDHRVPVTYVEVASLIDSLRPNADGASDIGTFQLTPVLLIDDLGAEKVTDWSLEQLYRLTNYRNARSLPMIVTTNLSSRELTERYGDRIARRITENCQVLRITSAPPQVIARETW